MTETKALKVSELNEEQIDLLKRTICKGATTEELGLFIATANRLGLDPFARQIFAVKRWDAKAGRENMTIQVSIDGFRAIAERTENYAPGPKPVFEEFDGILFKVTASVKKFTKGEWHLVEADAFWDEFVQTTREGKPTSMWARMPHVMLAKCAEAQALRKAFPHDLSGIYEPAEIDEDDGAPAIASDTTKALPAATAPMADLTAELKRKREAQEAVIIPDEPQPSVVNDLELASGAVGHPPAPEPTAPTSSSSPTNEPGVAGHSPTPEAQLAADEKTADDMIARIATFKNVWEHSSWGKKYRPTINSLHKVPRKRVKVAFDAKQDELKTKEGEGNG